MKEQNFKNHARYVPAFHFLLFAILLAVLVLSIINITDTVTLSSIMFVLLAITSIIAAFTLRVFALRAQDRAIRAEESLRHFVLTGNLPDKALTMDQIIALRFADDGEFIGLAGKAVKDGMSNKDIKMAVVQWRADHHRA